MKCVLISRLNVLCSLSQRNKILLVLFKDVILFTHLCLLPPNCPDNVYYAAGRSTPLQSACQWNTFVFLGLDYFTLHDVPQIFNSFYIATNSHFEEKQHSESHLLYYLCVNRHLDPLTLLLCIVLQWTSVFTWILGKWF